MKAGLVLFIVLSVVITAALAWGDFYDTVSDYVGDMRDHFGDDDYYGYYRRGIYGRGIYGGMYGRGLYGGMFGRGLYGGMFGRGLYGSQYMSPWGYSGMFNNHRRWKNPWNMYGY